MVCCSLLLSLLPRPCDTPKPLELFHPFRNKDSGRTCAKPLAQGQQGRGWTYPEKTENLQQEIRPWWKSINLLKVPIKNLAREEKFRGPYESFHPGNQELRGRRALLPLWSGQVSWNPTPGLHPQENSGSRHFLSTHTQGRATVLWWKPLWLQGWGLETQGMGGGWKLGQGLGGAAHLHDKRCDPAGEGRQARQPPLTLTMELCLNQEDSQVWVYTEP